ncbi:AI-2E family transporter [Novosphingobium sp.]|uniref:AI-2E family transporter n=1 Tax=Novosphingobium sp. TaxID=1874826 RepID=UPI0035B2D14D
MAETPADAPAQSPGKPARRARKSAVAAQPVKHGPGPTDFSDPLMRAEVKKAAVWIGMATLVGLVILLAQPLLVIFGGMVFAAMIDGGARLLGRVLPIGRGLRVTLVLLLAVSFALWVFYFAGTQIAEQAAALPATIEAQALRFLSWLKHQGFAIDVGQVQGLAEKLLGGIGQLTSAVGGLIGGVGTAFLIIVLGIYLAAEPQLYRRGVGWMLPVSERDHFEGTAVAMGRTLRMLMFGRLVGMAVEGVGTWVCLALYGVPMAGLLGLLTGLLAFLPNIGAPISGLLMVMVGFSVDTTTGLYCIAVYFIVQTIDGNVIVPMIAKKTADLAPALVLGMQLIMGALFGLIGLMLADPLVAMIKIALERQSLRNEGTA